MQRSVVILLVALSSCSAQTAPARGGGSTRSAAGTGTATGSAVSVVESQVSGASASSDGPLVVATNATGSAGRPANISDPNVCASAQVTATRITPTVLFVIDGSSSMNAVFGNGTRWSVLRDSLIGPTGVITSLEGAVRFGMAIYGSNATCPAMSEVPSALSSLMAITAAYPAMEPGVGTPTGEALQKVIDALPDFNNNGPDAAGETAPIIILATDGEPNGCGGAAAATCDWVGDLANCITNTVASAPATYDSTFAAVRAAKEKRIPVWVVSLADGLNAIPDLQKTANIGAGLADDAVPPAPIYSPTNSQDLTNTLRSLIGSATTCDVSLAGQLDVARACEGTVQINGSPLPCNDAQGWKAIDATHIALQGAACETFMSDPTIVLDASFPCDVVVLQ